MKKNKHYIKEMSDLIPKYAYFDWINWQVMADTGQLDERHEAPLVGINRDEALI